MTSSTLGYSEIEPFTNMKSIKKTNKTRRAKRENFESRKNVEAMINKIHNIESMESQLESEEEGLADFNPPPPAESTGVNRMRERRAKIEAEKNEHDDEDEPEHEQPPNFIASNQENTNYNIVPPYFEQEKREQKPKLPKKEDVIDVKLLMEKLNYVVSMLEEQQDEKVNTVTEEVVLYCFLGVFIIYVIDSFAKVGKYIR